jgi:hypothetical protein
MPYDTIGYQVVEVTNKGAGVKVERAIGRMYHSKSAAETLLDLIKKDDPTHVKQDSFIKPVMGPAFATKHSGKPHRSR